MFNKPGKCKVVSALMMSAVIKVRHSRIQDIQ